MQTAESSTESSKEPMAKRMVLANLLTLKVSCHHRPGIRNLAKKKDLSFKITLHVGTYELVLLRAKKSFLHFIGYQNFINDLTKLVSSQTLAHVQLRVCLKY